MPLKLFFSDYAGNKHLPSDQARQASIDEIVETMESVLHTPGNFAGLIDSNKTVLQFLVNDDQTIHVDLPIPADTGSWVKTASLEGSTEMVRNLGDEIVRAEIDGLEFESWQ